MDGLKGLLLLAGKGGKGKPKDDSSGDEGSGDGYLSDRDQACDNLIDGIRQKDRKLVWSAFKELCGECEGDEPNRSSQSSDGGDEEEDI